MKMGKYNFSGKSIVIGGISFLMVLFAMPLGHALMILMEHFLSETVIHYSAFTMGFAGLIMVIVGVFVTGDTKQTLWGLIGGLLFWTGWVEFLYVYYSHRFGVKPLLNEVGEVITKPEYLIMPSSFGFWVMLMLLYTFSIKTGCNFFNYLQKIFFKNNTNVIKIRPLTHHTSLVTFMELNMILWTSYLLLLFCYDENFIGDRSPAIIVVAIACLIGSVYMFLRLLTIKQWGYGIRYAIATVVVFWTAVEIAGRRNFLKEIWVHPLEYKNEMTSMMVSFLLILVFLFYKTIKKRKVKNSST